MNRTMIAATLAATMIGASASAAMFDQNITPDVIFGDGNANGGWTTETAADLELGLRAKVRFNDMNLPENTFNSNGDGSYTFLAGLPPTGFGFAPGSSSTAVWNFEWSINSDVAGTAGRFLDDLTYELQIDFDPSAGTNFQSFDPINLPAPASADHAIGTNTTANGDGTSVSNSPVDRPAYLALIGANNVAQNSWNMEFFDNAGGGFPFDGSQVGTYTIRLSASDVTGVLATTEILVNSVPEPTSAVLGLLGLIGVVSRRR